MLTTHALGLTLLAVSVLGLVPLGVQLFCVLRHFGTSSRAPGPAAQPVSPTPRGISILKPLCGVDDDLEANLENFATLGYPDYEVLLGVKNAQDPAHALALEAVARWPRRVRLVLQRDEPGLNPKVNQLITLAAAARHEVLLISDSNTRVGPGYLEEISRIFEDPTVGCLSHPVSGKGERTLGSLMDNLYQSTTGGAGQIAAKRTAGQDIVVGKSMALRRSTLEALGGFHAVRNHLAEDFVLGRWVKQRLGQRIVIADSPVYNVSQHKSVRTFFKRYVRWSIIHHTCIPTPLYLAQSLLNPLPWALLGALLAPSLQALGLVATVALLKVLADTAIFRVMRPGQRTDWRVVPAILLKDVLLFAAWANGLFSRSVDWRGNSLRVMAGSRLIAPFSPVEAPLPEPEGARQVLVG